MNLMQPMKKFCRESKEYFLHYRSDITKNNIILLRKTGIIVTILLCLYCTINFFMFNEPKLTILFIPFVAIFSLITTFAFVTSYKKYISFWLVQSLCMLFILCSMGFVIAISIFPFPNRPAIFYSIIYLLFCVIFILPVWQIHLILTGAEIVFLVLSYLFKAPATFGYDWYASITVWMIGFFFSYLMLDLRLRENRVRRELERISLTDDLTQLQNRRAFDQYAEAQYQYCQNNQLAFHVIMIDIDHFKDYNDCYGHVAGDQCLTKIASAISNAMGENKKSAFRYGGEEFSCIMTSERSISPFKQAKIMLEEIANQKIDMKSSQTGYVTVSIGIASVVPNGDYDYLAVVQNADAALYQAKAQGRNRIVVY
jgi:diguanylate cyclase (GGDEF)-like protein